LKNLQGPDILKLLIAVDIQECLIEKLNFCIKIQLVFLKLFISTDLWNFYLDVIYKEPKILFNSNKFINLKAPLLELLLKRD